MDNLFELDKLVIFVDEEGVDGEKGKLVFVFVVFPLHKFDIVL